MIKFFRKIRQKLLDENRFSKYLIYAIGEIVLVVIGILIALQINNRNEYNISYKNTINDLQKIKYELGQDIINFKTNTAYNNWAVKYFNHIKLKEFDSVNAKQIFKVVSGPVGTLDMSKSYNKLNASGNIDIVKDTLLVNALHDYYLEERKRFNSFAKFNIEFTSDKIEGYLIYELPLDENMNTTEAAILDEMEHGKLINLMNYQSGIFNMSTEHSEALIIKANNIINMIEKEVNQ